MLSRVGGDPRSGSPTRLMLVLGSALHIENQRKQNLNTLLDFQCKLYHSNQKYEQEATVGISSPFWVILRKTMLVSVY